MTRHHKIFAIPCFVAALCMATVPPRFNVNQARSPIVGLTKYLLEGEKCFTGPFQAGWTYNLRYIHGNCWALQSFDVP